MLVKVIPLNKNYEYHKINREIHNVLEKNPKLKSSFLKLNGLCCKSDDGKKLIFYKNHESEYGYFFESQLSEAFIYTVNNFLDTRNIDIKTAYDILLIAENVSLEILKMYELFNIVKWPSSRKGMDYFHSLKNFSAKLKNMLFEKSISLKEAYLLHSYFKKDYDKLLEMLNLGFSFSELNEIVRNIIEFAKKKSLGLDELIKILSNKQKEEIQKTCFEARFPMYSKYKNKFITYINELKLPKSVNVKYDETFEDQNYVLEIKYHNLSSLIKKLNLSNNSLQEYISNGGLDFFDHNILFNEENDK